jgi:hypothetical protein
MTDEPVKHRSGPLTLRLEDGEVTFTGSDTNALIDSHTGRRETVNVRG